MSIINFEETTVSYHEYFANALGVWAYKNGRRCGLGPFSVEQNTKVGHYIFRCGDENTFYIIADPQTETLIANYVWSDGHTCITESCQYTKPEVALGEDQIHIWLWALVHDDPAFYKNEVA